MRLENEQEAREKAVAIGGKCKSDKVMREDAIATTMRRSNQLHREMAYVREMLTSEPTPMQELEGKTKKKGKAKANDKREVNSDLPLPKMKPFRKMKKWLSLKMILDGS